MDFVIKWIWKIQSEVHLKLILYWLCMTILTTFYMHIIESTVCTKAFVSCLLIAFTFVGSLYIWRLTFYRDHPKTILRRFASVTITMLLSPVFVCLFVSTGEPDGFSLANVALLMGIRLRGIVQAIILPLLLTMILFLGPLVTIVHEDGIWRYFESITRNVSLRNLVWLRNHIMAPLSEEFSFRACMLPLLVKCYSEKTAVIVCPIFFGVAHAHHLIERIRHGDALKSAILETMFQFSYTTIFGAYSAFLFLRTGHFVAPLVVHSFCNHMGFPDFGEILMYSQPKRMFLIIAYLVGFLTWIKCLFPLTSPSLYQNTMFWQ